MGKIIGWLLGKIARIPPRKFEKTLEATLRVLSDRPRQKVDAILFFGRAEGDDQPELFDFVAELANSGKGTTVLVNGAQGQKKGSEVLYSSWPGGKIFKERLQKRGVKDVRFFPKENPTIKEGRACTTAEEAEGMLDYVINRMNCESVILVAWPHQILRCIGSMVSAYNKKKSSGIYLNIYCACPSNCDWLRDVAGSQGENVMERKFHINLEYSRVHQYVGKGVASIDEILAYLNRRDKNNR
jgi:hypothetical protein